MTFVLHCITLQCSYLLPCIEQVSYVQTANPIITDSVIPSGLFDTSQIETLTAFCQKPLTPDYYITITVHLASINLCSLKVSYSL